MTRLRDEIAREIAPHLQFSDFGSTLFKAGEIADAILSIPSIKEALELAEERRQIVADMLSGLAVTQGGKRIDPTSIFTEPESDVPLDG